MEYTLKNEKLTVLVSDKGAELRSLIGEDGTEYLWQGDERYWAERAPVLFPFTGRVIGGKYEWEKKTYSMGLHGFSRGRTFLPVQQTRDSIVLLSADDEETFAVYPRYFSFSVAYRLLENSVEVTFTVINEDDREMLFGLGGHPGFRVPLAEGKTFEEYRIRFLEPCAPERILLEQGFCTGNTEKYPLDEALSIPLNTELFSNDGIFLKDHAPAIRLETESDPHSVTVSAADMPYVGFWKLYDTGAHFVCMEPWWSLPSLYRDKTVFEEQPALNRLAPGKVFTRSWRITVR